MICYSFCYGASFRFLSNKNKMWNRPIMKKLIHLRPMSYLRLRNFHHEFTNPVEEKPEQQKETTVQTQLQTPKNQNQVSPGTILTQKYKIFRDEESPEIFDVEEERQRNQYEMEDTEDLNALNEAFYGLNLQRGIHGVFDVEDLVDVLRKENAEDIFVCSVPKDLKYVDYMIICSGRSYRHMLAMAEFVRRVYKMKRTKGDVLPKIEGEKSRDWMAMDLGNIALHIFSATAREEYDLESLWAIGPEYDNETNKPQDPLVELFERHTFLMESKPNT